MIIHGEQDQLIPFSTASPCTMPARLLKKIEKIAGAGHNDIFLRGLDQYLSAVKSLLLLKKPALKR